MTTIYTMQKSKNMSCNWILIVTICILTYNFCKCVEVYVKVYNLAEYSYMLYLDKNMRANEVLKAIINSLIKKQKKYFLDSLLTISFFLQAWGTRETIFGERCLFKKRAWNENYISVTYNHVRLFKSDIKIEVFRPNEQLLL